MFIFSDQCTYIYIYIYIPYRPSHYNTLPVRSVSDIFGNKAWGEILNQNIVLTCKLSLIQKLNIKTWIPIARRTIIHLLIETCLKMSRNNLRWNSESEGRLELTNLTLIQKLRKIGCIRSLCSFHALPDCSTDVCTQALQLFWACGDSASTVPRGGK